MGFGGSGLLLVYAKQIALGMLHEPNKHSSVYCMHASTFTATGMFSTRCTVAAC